jgi:alpha-tubulin suppressor-like RCC1 family protein
MEDGSVWGWGGADDGQIGTGTILDIAAPAKVKLPPEISEKRIVNIGCGFTHSFFLTEDGELFLFGCNSEGQISGEKGLPSKNDIPIRILADLKFALPRGANESKWKILKWLFLGKICQNSGFSVFPVEVIFHFTGLARSFV